MNEQITTNHALSGLRMTLISRHLARSVTTTQAEVFPIDHWRDRFFNWWTSMSHTKKER